jgi:hypothetical protein
MNTAFDILVIGLGCLLAIYLIISIVVVILIMKLVKALREVVSKGEQLMDSAEAIGETLRRNAGAVGIVRVLMHFMNNMGGTRRKG